jgi:methylmalonyl-CoA mutase N-terminal domain/subunit
MEIAKFRAARALWARIVEAFGGSTEAQLPTMLGGSTEALMALEMVRDEGAR